jgi:hypothetical protein
MGAPSSLAPSLEGKIREPISSDDEDDEEEAEDEEVEATEEVTTSTPTKRKRDAVTKTPSKRAKAPILVQSKLTTMVGPTPVKTTNKKSSSAMDTEELIDLLESSDEFNDFPRIKG